MRLWYVDQSRIIFRESLNVDCEILIFVENLDSEKIIVSSALDVVAGLPGGGEPARISG